MTMTRTPAYGCTNPGAAKIQNDGGEAIGNPVGPKGDNLSESSVQNALAQSSNTAFTDLTHRAGTSNVITMASSYGVDTSVTAPAGQRHQGRCPPSPSARPR